MVRKYAVVLFLLLCLVMRPAWASFTLISSGVVTAVPTGSTPLGTVGGAAYDLAGNLYVTDTTNNRIVSVGRDGVTAAALSITGLGTALSSPRGLAIDSAGNLYIADTGNSRIVMVTAAGAGSVISTASITLNAPQGVAVTNAGDIFISDTGNSRIVKIPSGGAAAVFTITSLSPALSNQRGIAADTSGRLYIADTGNSRVVKVSTAGVASAPLTTAAGTALSGPSAVAVGNNGMFYVADTNTTPSGNPTPGRVVIVDSQGNARELLTGYPVFNSPLAVAVSPLGKLYVGDNGGTANAGRVQSFQSFTTDVSNTFTSSVGFGPVQLGSAGATLTIPFSVGGSTTLSTVGVSTSGVANLDFTIGNTSTCAAGTTATTCNVVVTFAPTAAGLRKGALVLAYGSGSLTVPLYGVADAPVAALSPALASVLNIGSTTLSSPFQTAVDPAGNTYVTNYGASTVKKIPAGGGTGTSVSTGSYTLNQPTGVALDGAGNLFIADYGNSRIIKIDTAGTASLFAISGLSQAINLPTALAFDAASNLYITDYGSGRMVEVNPYGQGTVMASGSITFASTAITGSAVDTNGTVYIADRTNNRIVKIDALGKTTILSFSGVGALNNPEGVSVDPSGTVYVMDSNNVRIIRITTSGATSVMPISAVTLGSFIFGITADPNGNLLVADWSNNRLVKVNVGASAVSFATTNTGATSSDSPKTVTVTNLGDQPLILSAAQTYTTDFSQNSSDTNPCTATTNLAAGTNCDVSIKFTPQTGGSLSANITVTSNTLNVSGSTQQIAASGTGIQTAVAPTITWSDPSAIAYGTPLSSTQLNASTTAAGTFAYTPAADTVLTAGTQTLSTTFTPTNSSAYTTATKTVSLSVTKLATTTTATSSGTTLTATVTASYGTPTGSVQFTSGATEVGSGTLDSSGAVTATASSTPTGAVTATYSGDANYVESTGTVSAPTATFTLAASSADASSGRTPTVDLSAGGTGTGTLSFSATAGFSGDITFSCSGLPSYATCSFDPETIHADGSTAALDDVTITIAPIKATSNMANSGSGTPRTAGLFLLPGALASGIVGFRRRKNGPKKQGLLVLGVLSIFAAMAGCGSSHTYGHTYDVTVTATATNTPTDYQGPMTTSTVIHVIGPR